MGHPFYLLLVLALIASNALAQSDEDWQRLNSQLATMGIGTACELDGNPAALSTQEVVDRVSAARRCLRADRLAVQTRLRQQMIDGGQPEMNLWQNRVDTLDGAIEDVDAMLAPAIANRDFMGLGWGLGFGFSKADGTRVSEAAVVDGVVRATKDSSEQARVFLEYHWFPDKLASKDNANRIQRAWGPFIAVAASEDNVLSGIGAGAMLGFKDAGDSEGFAIAVGFMLDNDVRSLARGFTVDEPLPEGETEVRYIDKSELSYILFMTRTF